MSRAVLVVALVVTAIAAAAGSETSSTEKHWAFQPLGPSPPPDDPSGWAEQAIDKFVIAQLREKGLNPVELADKRTLSGPDRSAPSARGNGSVSG